MAMVSCSTCTWLLLLDSCGAIPSETPDWCVARLLLAVVRCCCSLLVAVVLWHQRPVLLDLLIVVMLLKRFQ